jgi:hypothetical protein
VRQAALQEIDDIADALDTRLVSVPEGHAESILELDDESELLDRVELQIAEKVGVLGKALDLELVGEDFSDPFQDLGPRYRGAHRYPSARSSQRIRVCSMKAFRRLKPIAVRYAVWMSGMAMPSITTAR